MYYGVAEATITGIYKNIDRASQISEIINKISQQNDTQLSITYVS